MASLQEERMQILKMIEDKVVTAAEGLELMNALDDKEVKLNLPQKKPKWLKVRIQEGENKNKVKINLPISLVNAGLKIAETHMNESDKFNVQGIDFEEIAKEVQNGAQGRIVDIVDEQDNTHIVISVEENLEDE